MNRDHKPQKNKMKIPRIHFKYNRDWKRNNKKLGSQTMQRTREQKRKTKIDTMPYRLSQNKIIESICFCEHFRNFRFRIFPLSEELKRNLDWGLMALRGRWRRTLQRESAMDFATHKLKLVFRQYVAHHLGNKNPGIQSAPQAFIFLIFFGKSSKTSKKITRF